MSDTCQATATQPITIDEVQQDIVDKLQHWFKVESTDNGFRLTSQNKYSVKFTLSELDTNLQRQVKVSNPPFEFLRAVVIYKNLPEYIQIDTNNNGKKELNWNTPLNRLLSHLYIIQRLHHEKDIQKVIFIDSNNFKTRNDVDDYLTKHNVDVDGFDHLVIAYNYKSENFCGIYGSVRSGNFAAVTNYEIKSSLGTISNILQSMYPDRTTTTAEQQIINTLGNQMFCLDILSAICPSLKIDTYIQADRLLCIYAHVPEGYLEIDKENCKMADQTKQLLRAKLNEIYGKTPQLSQPEQSTKVEQPVQQSSEQKTQPVTKEEIKKKYDLTDQQFNTLDLYLSMPQTSPDTFNLDQVINQIKNNINTGWQLLLQKHNK